MRKGLKDSKENVFTSTSQVYTYLNFYEGFYSFWLVLSLFKCQFITLTFETSSCLTHSFERVIS